MHGIFMSQEFPKKKLKIMINLLFDSQKNNDDCVNLKQYERVEYFF